MDGENTDTVNDRSSKSATAARIYDHFLGGVHNFPADREAARRVIAAMPDAPAMARTNRAFLGRAVRFLADEGVCQFLDLGSGMPTQGNVHEIAQRSASQARVVYVDIDPVAVSESMEILEGNEHATAVLADLREPETILENPQVRDLLDFDQPVALLLCAVLHFVPDDAQAYGLTSRLREALAPGSYLVVSHGSNEGAAASITSDEHRTVQGVYGQRTATPAGGRSHAGVAQFFGDAALVDPGVVWAPTWRPEPSDPQEFAEQPQRSCLWVGVGHLT